MTLFIVIVIVLLTYNDEGSSRTVLCDLWYPALPHPVVAVRADHAVADDEHVSAVVLLGPPLVLLLLANRVEQGESVGETYPELIPTNIFNLNFN